jgi:type I restriction enzyme S subunit
MKDNKKGLVPRLRFPEFRDAGEWDDYQLSQISERITDKVGSRKLVTASITAGLGFVSQAEKFGRDISGNQYKNYILLKKGQFSYNKGNSKAFPQGCIYELNEFEEVAAPSAFISFKFNSKFVPNFFKGYFDNNFHGYQLLRFITSGARSDGLLNISPNDFFSIRLPTPKKEEQQKIADCLSSLDTLIAAQADKLDALKAHKKGLMQQLFPREGETVPRLRFPEFRDGGEWEERRLEDMAKRGSGHTPNKKISSYYNGGIKWVSLADSNRLDAGYIYDTKIEISEDGIDNSSAVLHPAGTVILSRDAGVGKSAVLYSPMAVSQHFMAWQCHKSELSNWFLYYLLQKNKTIFEVIAVGNAIKTIGISYFKEMTILAPAIPEQQKIADCLSSLDTLIAAQADKLDALKAHKKGLMQQLFPSPEVVGA